MNVIDQIDIEPQGLFFEVYYHSWFGDKRLPGPYRNRYVKTPDDLINALNGLSWNIADNSYLLAMNTYMSISIPAYNLKQDILLDEYWDKKSKALNFVVTNSKKLPTFQELAKRCGREREITEENKDKPAFCVGFGIFEAENNLIVNKDDLHELNPTEASGVSPTLLKMFNPTIGLLDKKNKEHTK